MELQEKLKDYWKKLIKIEIDVKAFVNNISIIRKFIGKNTKIILAAKSYTYSLGKEMVAYSKDFIDGIAVESLHSAIEHASNGFDKSIYILSPFIPQGFDLLPELNKYKNIVICLDSLTVAENLIKQCKEKKYTVRAAIKINWGLNRFGIMPNQLKEMMNLLEGSPVIVDSIYTHLSGTTDSDIESLKTKEKLFLELVKDYRGRGINFHIADSACTVRKIGIDMDIVRIGLLPIGIDPVEVEHETIEGLKLCFKLISTVLHITEVKKGQELGYRYFAPENMRVATILGGYAHGLPRDASAANGFALLGGIKCPYACKSFMEYSIIDISSCNFPVSPGDKVEIYGNECHPYNLAITAGNIPEIFFTSLSRLIYREYIK
ncbi:alanine racemase [Candidatus Dependentiae bacterium]|nr:alanine racemase [Candidatus Dependentiae bacterium]